jgi:hypothetical protein
MTFGPLDTLFDFLRDDIIAGNLALGMWMLLALLLLAQEIGYRLGRFMRKRREPMEAEKSSLNFATAGMVGLLAFLLGISLSMASGRYEARRDSVLAEANSIGTTWLRAGMVGGAEGQAIQRTLRDYTRLRIDTINGGESPDEVERMYARTAELQNDMWQAAQRASERAPTPITALMVGALNETIDLSLTNRRNFSTNVPAYVIRLLILVSMLTMGAIGYGFGIVGGRQVIMSVLFLFIWTISIALIVDIDRPRSGGIRVGTTPLVWTLQGFGPEPPAR